MIWCDIFLGGCILRVLVYGLLVHHPSICYAWLALTRGMFGHHELLRIGGCQFTSLLGNIYGQGLTLGNHPQSLSLDLPWHVMAHAQSIPCCTFGGCAAADVRNELVFVSHCNGCLQLTRCAGSANSATMLKSVMYSNVVLQQLALLFSNIGTRHQAKKYDVCTHHVQNRHDVHSQRINHWLLQTSISNTCDP